MNRARRCPRSLQLAALLACALLVTLSLGCSSPESPAKEEDGVDESSAQALPRLRVVSTAAPLEWLVRRIGGPAVESVLMPPVGVLPEDFTPTPEEILAAADADLIVANGAGLEGWMATATLPESRLVRTAEGLELIETQGQTHSHGPGGEHSHAATDAHSFTDPSLLAEQGARVLESLSRVRPEESAAFTQRYQTVKAELDDLAAEYRAAFALLGEAPLLASAGHFAYLARLGGVELRTVPLAADVEPSGHDLGHLRGAVGDGATLMLWSEAPADTVVAALPEQVAVVVLAPLSTVSGGAEYDYLAVARSNLEKIEAAVADSDP